MSNDISEEHVASIFRVEEYAQEESSMKAGGNPSETEKLGCFGFRYKRVLLCFINT
jgi:hypothetical protein